MNSLAPTQITNFGQWCAEKYRDGGIRVIGDAEDGYELSIDAETLNAGWRWLVQSCAKNDGESCLEFLSDNFFDEMTDGYAAKKVLEALDVTGSDLDAAFDALSALRDARSHYVTRRIECHKSDLVERFEQRGKPDPMDIRKDRIESGMVRRYRLGRL